jgi:hypothetical protein
MGWGAGSGAAGGGGGLPPSAAANTDANGTTPVSVGSVKLQAGTLTISAYIGCQNPAHAATLELRRASNGAVLTTLGGVAGGLQDRTATVVVPATDWYEARLSCNNPQGTAMFRGLSYTS